MAVLGESFTPHFGATVPFPSSPLCCLMGQVSRLDPLVKGNHPTCVGRFKVAVQISLGLQKEGRVRMSKQDKGRKWIWWFLGAIAAMQLYFVRELLAAYTIFMLGFAAIGICIATLYTAQKAWEAGVAQLAASRNPMILAVRRSVASVEDLARRPIRRPDSQPVS
jgi:hypothetical protein